MLKKLLMCLVSLTLAVGAWAVELNKADQAELDSVKGIGPAISKRIVDERSKNGPFKDWADFEKRVKGVGEKTAAKMSASGLTVNGRAMEGAPAAKADSDKSKAKSSSSASSSADKSKSKSSSDKADTRPSASAGASSKAGDKKESDKKESGK